MILLIIGGLNWGLVGLFDMDLVAFCSVPRACCPEPCTPGRRFCPVWFIRLLIGEPVTDRA